MQSFHALLGAIRSYPLRVGQRALVGHVERRATLLLSLGQQSVLSDHLLDALVEATVGTVLYLTSTPLARLVGEVRGALPLVPSSGAVVAEDVVHDRLAAVVVKPLDQAGQRGDALSADLLSLRIGEVLNDVDLAALALPVLRARALAVPIVRAVVLFVLGENHELHMRLRFQTMPLLYGFWHQMQVFLQKRMP